MISCIKILLESFIRSERKLIILLINVSTKTILYTMSDILDKLNNLEHNLNLLSKKIDSTNLENTLLKNQQTKLVSEKSDLIKKNESAKSQLKSLLDRIDSMKNHGKE